MDKSVVINSKEEFDAVKLRLGTDRLYLDFHQKMAEIQTGIVVKSKNNDYPVGSIGRASGQKEAGFTLISFEDFMKS